MTRENAKQWMHIIEAYASGEEIQWKGEGSGGEWLTIAAPCFEAPGEYRIKPKPREFWINIYSHGIRGVYTSKKSAEVSAGERDCDLIECIHVREVMDE